MRALLSLLQRHCLHPSGRGVTREEIAGLLGIAPKTLAAYCTQWRRRGTGARPIPFTTLYCLEALAANADRVARELWPEDADATA